MEWRKIMHKDIFLLLEQRKVNGNMDSAKHQSEIIHDVKMILYIIMILCECVVFPQKDIFYT